MTLSSLLRVDTPETKQHFKLANGDTGESKAAKSPSQILEEELVTTPLFSLAACERLNEKKQLHEKSQTSIQYGLLGLQIPAVGESAVQEDLVYANVSAPWSAFICGSQGSGKSHSLSCLLENSLITPSSAGKLTSPLTGLIMHYDKFTAFSSTQLCEAAYLYSSGIPVRVLVSPTNYLAMKKAYTELSGGSKLLTVEPLYLPQKDINISMMKMLMGINHKADQPLYIEIVMKILRDMAIANQGRTGFNYAGFKTILENEHFIKGQIMPLNMRLQVLESFFEPGSVPGAPAKKSHGGSADIWNFPPGGLTIIDLSCPFVGPEDACALFNISLSLFLKDRHKTGRVIALDEAHKFLTSTSPEALDLTETLLSIIRQQRHLGARVLIATQEPTLAPALLELCNMTIIHRFSSPAWFKAIKSHIAGADDDNGTRHRGSDPRSPASIFHKIVRLATGEALVFCPTALFSAERALSTLGWTPSSETFGRGPVFGASSPADPGFLNGFELPVDTDLLSTDSDTPTSDPSLSISQLGPGYVHLRVRQRLTVDGGRSVLEC